MPPTGSRDARRLRDERIVWSVNLEYTGCLAIAIRGTRPVAAPRTVAQSMEVPSAASVRRPDGVRRHQWSGRAASLVGRPRMNAGALVGLPGGVTGPLSSPVSDCDEGLAVFGGTSFAGRRRIAVQHRCRWRWPPRAPCCGALCVVRGVSYPSGVGALLRLLGGAARFAAPP